MSSVAKSLHFSPTIPIICAKNLNKYSHNLALKMSNKVQYLNSGTRNLLAITKFWKIPVRGIVLRENTENE